MSPAEKANKVYFSLREPEYLIPTINRSSNVQKLVKIDLTCFLLMMKLGFSSFNELRYDYNLSLLITTYLYSQEFLCWAFLQILPNMQAPTITFFQRCPDFYHYISQYFIVFFKIRSSNLEKIRKLGGKYLSFRWQSTDRWRGFKFFLDMLSMLKSKVFALLSEIQLMDLQGIIYDPTVTWSNQRTSFDCAVFFLINKSTSVCIVTMPFFYDS